MHLRILATDLDGTLAEHGQIAPATWAALRDARARGLTLILVTGRTLASFAPEGPFAEHFDAIVAEDGAVVYLTRSGAVHMPFGQIPRELRDQIGRLGLPVEYGLALVATRTPHDGPIAELLRGCGGGAALEYNKGAVMVIPPGATKGSGLEFALRELGLSARNVVAAGDAENDRSLLAGAELAVAVANATPEIAAAADVVLAEPDGEGMRGLLAGMAAGRLPARRDRPDRMITLGRDGSQPCRIDPWLLLDGSAVVAGDSSSGKSWLAGLLAEALIARGYQVLVVDPEGDYRGLATLPRTMLVGSPDTRLRRVGDIATLCEHAHQSLVVDLSATPMDLRADFTERLLHEVVDMRARTGRPHWILLDEIHQTCALRGDPLADALLELLRSGGVTLVSYQPSLVPPQLLEAVQTWVLTRVSAPREAELLANLLAEPGRREDLAAQLGELVLGQAQVLTRTPVVTGGPGCARLAFRIGSRQVPHIRHLHKYVRVPLPQEKWFVFHTPDGAVCGTAANLSEFLAALRRAPAASLAYHLRRDDFCAWLETTLHDAELARQVRKVAHRELRGEDLRAELVAAVSSRYEELSALL